MQKGKRKKRVLWQVLEYWNQFLVALVQYLVCPTLCLQMWVCGWCCTVLFWHASGGPHSAWLQNSVMLPSAFKTQKLQHRILWLTKHIQNISEAKDVSPYSSCCTTAFHFCWRQKFICSLFSVYTLIVELTVNHLSVRTPDGCIWSVGSCVYSFVKQWHCVRILCLMTRSLYCVAKQYV